MFTQCPHCDTRFRIRAQEIRVAAGKVHCGRCNNVFNAIDTLYDDGDNRAPAPASAPPPGADRWRAEAQPGDGQHSRATDADDGAGELPFEIPDGLPELQPAPARDGRASTPRATGGGGARLAAWSIGVLALLFLAMGQLAWHQRERLLLYPEGRTLLSPVCAVLGCTLPYPGAPDMIVIRARSIATHPERENALRVSLVFANGASFAQRYPDIQLSFFDAVESLVAQRRFTPAEYLARPAAQPVHLSPGELAEVTMDLEDPGEEVTGFRFDFF